MRLNCKFLGLASLSVCVAQNSHWCRAHVEQTSDRWAGPAPSTQIYTMQSVHKCIVLYPEKNRPCHAYSPIL